MKSCLWMPIVGLALAWNVWAEDAGKRELDKLQGHWQVVSAEHDGKRIPKEEIEKPDQPPPLPSGKQAEAWRRNRILIKGNRVRIGEAGNARFMTIKLLPSATANPVDIIDGDNTLKGVYSLKEDELTICCAKAGKDRPTKLESKKGSGWTLLVLKRVKG